MLVSILLMPLLSAEQKGLQSQQIQSLLTLLMSILMLQPAITLPQSIGVMAQVLAALSLSIKAEALMSKVVTPTLKKALTALLTFKLLTLAERVSQQQM